MSRQKVTTKQFRKDYRLMYRSGYNMDLLDAVIDLLADDQTLPEKYHDHALSNNWQGYRECHIKPDWLLIYQYVDDDQLYLARTGSHTSLFD